MGGKGLSSWKGVVMTTTNIDVRPATLAGHWYPADAEALRTMVRGFIDDADPIQPTGRIEGLLVPHAGLRYSGPVAGAGFKLIQDMTPEVVVILAPYHRPPPALYDQPLATTAHHAYETPLGNVPVDQTLLTALGECVSMTLVRCDQEHAIEIELPFLQGVLDHEFTLLPVMLLDQSHVGMKKLAQALVTVLAGRDVLLIASSDLSHFFPQDVAHQLDEGTLAGVRTYEPERVLQSSKKPGEGACGRGAIAAVMWAAQERGADHSLIAAYATSGDTGGDRRQVVGYAAGSFYAKTMS